MGEKRIKDGRFSSRRPQILGGIHNNFLNWNFTISKLRLDFTATGHHGREGKECKVRLKNSFVTLIFFIKKTYFIVLLCL